MFIKDKVRFESYSFLFFKSKQKSVHNTKILAISGSLRSNSANTCVLQVAKMVDANNSTLAIAGRRLKVQEIVADTELSAALIETITKFIQTIKISG